MVDLARKSAKEKTVAQILADQSTQTKWQVKYLQANHQTTGAITDLTFNGLVVGKTYKATLHGNAAITTGSNSCRADIVHDGNTLARFEQQLDASGAQGRNSATTHAIFVATTTTVFVNAQVMSATSYLQGIGGADASRTWFMIEELPNHVETTDFT